MMTPDESRVQWIKICLAVLGLVLAFAAYLRITDILLQILQKL